MMMAKKKTQPRKVKTGIAAAPTDSFHWFSSHLRMDVDKKEIAVVLKDYIKANYQGKERALLLSGPDYIYAGEAGVAATIAWKSMGHEWDAKWNGKRHIETYIGRVRALADAKALTKPDDSIIVIPKRSPMQIVQEKSSDFIAEIEEVVDMFGTGDMFVDWKNYSVYNEMVKVELNSISAKHVLDYYKPLLSEMEELVNDKTDDLLEAYCHWTVPERKDFLKIISDIVNDAEKYVMSKKASRKPKKPRVKSADKQVTKLNYLKDSGEFKLTSINPALIIGETRLYTFNVKTKTLTEYITERPKGFEVKGSTIYGIDLDRSRSIRLRKPEEHLSVFQTKTPTAINKFWATLTTKTNETINGRVNKDTIILRVLNK